MIAKSKQTNPYPGPRPFECEESGIFFGRAREVRELLSLITAHRVVLLYAQSGAGKTSLLNAGVIPLLTEEGFEVLPVARVRGFEPEDIDLGKIPNIYAFNVLIGWAIDSVQSASLVSRSIGTFLKEREHLTDEQGLSLPRVAIFDQFEELFTSYPGRWEEREGLFRQVAEALGADPLLRVLFVIREDYLASLDSHVDLLPERLRTRYRLERLRADAACQAVEGPLRDTGRRFAEGVALSLVHKLLNIRVENVAGEIVEVPGEYVEPVQLQVVCQSLWLNLPRDVTDITSDHVEEFGDVQEALQSFYEKAIKTARRQTGVRKSNLRRWFNEKLITPAGTRGTVFRGKEQTEGIPNSAVDVLEAQHIIRAEIRAGARWYELTHDRLIEPIRKCNAGKQTGSLRRFLRLATAAIVVMLMLAAGIVAYGFFHPQGLIEKAQSLMSLMTRTSQLTVTAVDGSVTKDPNKPRYYRDEKVTLTAMPDPNYRFDRWSGDLSGSTNPTTLVMDADKTVTASFALKTYSLTAAAVDGSVTKDPNKVRYNHGETVTSEAVPDPNYRFDGWSGDLSGPNESARLVMDSDKSITANFVKTYSLTATGVNGSVTATAVDGFSTKDPDQVRYDEGDTVTLEAVPTVGYRFTNWSGDLSDDSNPTKLVMGADKTVTANFVKTYSLSVTAVDGSVTKDPDQVTYDEGDKVKLEAVPNEGYRFTNWSGALSDSNNPAPLDMDAHKSVTANFVLKTYSLIVTAADGSATKDPDKVRYNHGETVTLEGVPNTGYRFTNWSGDLSGTTNPTTLVMNEDKTVTANFALKTYSLTTNAADGSVTKDPNKVRYNHGETVTLEGVPNTGHRFTNWSGDLSGATNPTTLDMDADKSVTANFVKTYSLSVTAVDGSVTKDPDQVTYDEGDRVKLEAVPSVGYRFTNWSGALSDSNNPAPLVMDADKTVTANFALPIEDGLYVITSVSSNKSLNVENTKQNVEAKYEYYGNSTQQWSLEHVDRGYYRVMAKDNEKMCLEVFEGRANIQLNEWQDTENQKWTLEFTGEDCYKIVAGHSGKYLDIDGSSGLAIQNTGSDSDSQKWIVQPADSYPAILPTKGTNEEHFIILGKKYAPRCLVVTDNKARIMEWMGNDNQRWRLVPVGDGYFRICTKDRGDCLTVKDNSVLRQPYVGDESQKWRVKKHEPIEESESDDFYYEIENRQSGMCLAVDEKSRTSDVVQKSHIGSENQKWQLKPAEQSWIGNIAVTIRKERPQGRDWEKIPVDLNKGCWFSPHIWLWVRGPARDNIRVTSGGNTKQKEPQGKSWEKEKNRVNLNEGCWFSPNIWLWVRGPARDNIEVTRGRNTKRKGPQGKGWKQIGPDLNEGAWGKYLYLWVR